MAADLTRNRLRRFQKAATDNQELSASPFAEDPLEIPKYFIWKERMNRCLGASLLVIAVPIIVPLALLVRCTSRGPAFFCQKRLGKNGQEFMMYKLRTMCDNAEEATGPVWCRPADPRITCLGRFLRLFHFDELPQLLNVARGEMSLIGPRPERPELIDGIVEEVPDFCERLAVRPGVTGLAQVNLPADTDYDATRAKLALDLKYIEAASPWLDTRILLCSAFRMLGIRQGRAVRWFRLQQQAMNGAAHESEPNGQADPKHEPAATPPPQPSPESQPPAKASTDTERDQGDQPTLQHIADHNDNGNGQAPAEANGANKKRKPRSKKRPNRPK